MDTRPTSTLPSDSIPRTSFDNTCFLLLHVLLLPISSGQATPLLRCATPVATPLLPFYISCCYRQPWSRGIGPCPMLISSPLPPDLHAGEKQQWWTVCPVHCLGNGPLHHRTNWHWSVVGLCCSCPPTILSLTHSHGISTTIAVESWAPEYTWHAFRYVEIDARGTDVSPLTAADIKCYPMRSDVSVVGPTASLFPCRLSFSPTIVIAAYCC